MEKEGAQNTGQVRSNSNVSGLNTVIRVSRVLHAGYIFECGKTRLLFDPLFENPFSQNCFAFPSVQFDQAEIKKQKFDAVVISHYHDDHCSFESLNLLDRSTPIYLFCVHEEMFSLLRELGFSHVHSLELNQAVEIGEFQITPRPALDVDVDSIVEVSAKGLRILNVVDSWIDPHTLKRLSEQSWDLVLWPFQTMREIEVIAPSCAEPASGKIPEEWIEQLQSLKPRYLVPSSCQFRFEDWSWLNKAFFPISYLGFSQQMKSILPTTRVVRMDPGTVFELDNEDLSLRSRLPWVLPTGKQDEDYAYQSDIEIPLTSDIAKRLGALSDDETAAVLKYCETGIREAYEALSASAEPFFSSCRRWQLNVYDQQGKRLSFYYLLENHAMNHREDREPAEWTTEIPLIKLYGALFCGESLSSLYLRIENVDKNADIVEDPLLRCLFSNSLGSYQKAQLKRICRVE